MTIRIVFKTTNGSHLLSKRRKPLKSVAYEGKVERSDKLLNVRGVQFPSYLLKCSTWNNLKQNKMDTVVKIIAVIVITLCVVQIIICTIALIGFILE